jgi:glyceraldehyde-3-phosphate dehydrogenase (ferredoxin)
LPYKFVVDHYLKQFNEETIQSKQQRTCGEPCVAVCKKMRGEFKKDYEPYQTLGPLSGIFDQRAAEKLNHHADMYGFDAISVGGVISWLMECLSENLLTPEELGVKDKPVFTPQGFSLETDSMHNVDPELVKWVEYFEKDKQEAALSFWYEVHKGIQESLRDF